jgi:hypothetical protein
MPSTEVTLVFKENLQMAAQMVVHLCKQLGIALEEIVAPIATMVLAMFVRLPVKFMNLK